jgi:hypothetical protein
MTQLAISFVDTRARRADPQTSRDAARYSASQKACQERLSILLAVHKQPMTAREIAAETGIDYIEVQRRISEVAGIEKSGERRDGCMVWRALFFTLAQPEAVTQGKGNKPSRDAVLQGGIDHHSAQGAIDQWNKS